MFSNNYILFHIEIYIFEINDNNNIYIPNKLNIYMLVLMILSSSRFKIHIVAHKKKIVY